MTRRLLGLDAPAARPHNIKRRVIWVLLPSLLIVALLLALWLSVPPAEFKIPVSQTCRGDGPVCDRMFKITADSRGRARAEFSVGRAHCSPMRLHFFVDDKEVKAAEREFGFGAGTSNGPLTVSNIDLGLVNVGSVIGLQAEVLPGGCAANPLILASWGGELTLTITRWSPPPWPS